MRRLPTTNVNPAYFVGPWAWRYELLLEQRGVLSLSIGRQDRSDCSVPACSGSMDSEPESGVRRDGHLHFRSRKRRNCVINCGRSSDELTQHEDWCWLRSAEQNPDARRTNG